jgi:hypothetical protein
VAQLGRPVYRLAMARVAAIERGELAARGAWTGRIVSVHGRALNILRADGRLVSVVTRESDMTAMSVLVPALLQGGTSVAGREIRCDGLRLRTGTEELVDLTAARRWSGRVGCVPRIEPRALEAAAGALLAHRGPLCLADLLAPERPPGSEAAAAAAARLAAWRDGSSALGGLGGLVGLGPGLTPAGDDFLTGMLLADTLGLGGLPLPGTRRLDAGDLSAMGRALGSTTAAGRTLLELALDRRFPAYLLAFAGAPSAAAAARASEHGATSGTDAVAGFLWMARAPRPCPLGHDRVHYPTCSAG